MRKLVFIVLVTITGIDLKAQKNNIAFHSINSVSFFMGESETSWGFQTVNGIAYKNLFSGIGVGADYYHYNSYPLFFDQRIYFGRNSNLFAYGDLGYNLNNKKNKPGKEVGYYSSYHFRGGVYTGCGLGYKHLLTGKSFITLSAGFSYKQANNKVRIIEECLTATCPVDYQNYQYDNGRVDVRAGIDF